MDSKISGLKIYFRNLEIPLEFKFFDNSFVNKWKVQLAHALNQGAGIQNGGSFYGSAIFTKAELVERLKNYVDFINNNCTERIDLIPTIELDQNFLNELHKEFERIGGLLATVPSGPTQQVYEALVNLNTAIHQCEMYTKSSTKVSNYFSFDVNFLVSERYNLELDDYRYFTTERLHGEIYLNYATIGVPALEAFKNNEIETPVPQKQYKADFRVSFSGGKKYPYNEKLNQWISDKYFWNYEDPTVAKGYIPLGQVLNLNYTQQELFEKVQLDRQIKKVELIYSS